MSPPFTFGEVLEEFGSSAGMGREWFAPDAFSFPRLGRTSEQLEQRRSLAAKYYYADHARTRAIAKSRYWKNPEQRRAYAREWYWKNVEKEREKGKLAQRRRRKEQPEKLRAYQREYQRAWRMRNLEKNRKTQRENMRRYRAARRLQ